VDWWQNRSQNEVRAHRASRPSVAEITRHLLIGEYLHPNDIGWLKESFHVTAVHNLQDDDDLRLHGLDLQAVRAECDANGIRFVRTPIQDGSADAMGERLRVALDDLHALIADGRRVYVHCNAGLNRAPTLVIGYLRAHGKMSLDEAVAHVKKHRACGPFMTILEDYFGPRHIKPK
jgi:protein-tyrosine phosphatase